MALTIDERRRTKVEGLFCRCLHQSSGFSLIRSSWLARGVVHPGCVSAARCGVAPCSRVSTHDECRHTLRVAASADVACHPERPSYSPDDSLNERAGGSHRISSEDSVVLGGPPPEASESDRRSCGTLPRAHFERLWAGTRGALDDTRRAGRRRAMAIDARWRATHDGKRRTRAGDARWQASHDGRRRTRAGVARWRATHDGG